MEAWRGSLTADSPGRFPLGAGPSRPHGPHQFTAVFIFFIIVCQKSQAAYFWWTLETLQKWCQKPPFKGVLRRSTER